MTQPIRTVTSDGDYREFIFRCDNEGVAREVMACIVDISLNNRGFETKVAVVGGTMVTGVAKLVDGARAEVIFKRCMRKLMKKHSVRIQISSTISLRARKEFNLPDNLQVVA